MGEEGVLQDSSIEPISTECTSLKFDEKELNQENDLNALNTLSATLPTDKDQIVPLSNGKENLLSQVEELDNHAIQDERSSTNESAQANEQLHSRKRFKNINFDDSDDEIDNTDLKEPVGIEDDLNNRQNDSEHRFLLNDDSNASTSEQKNEVQIKNKRKRFVMDSDSEDDSVEKTEKIEEHNVGQESQSLMPSLTNLCDSESSEAEPEDDNQVEYPIKKLKEVSKPSKSGIKEKIPKPKKMTGKDALKQRQEIKSESQRMLRETPISLPYHKPKERSIKEFLKNRPRLSILKTDHDVPASAAIKMTTEQLQEATKKMEEREKELKKFYKSESESEEEVVQEEDETVNVTSEEVVTQDEVNKLNECEPELPEETVEDGPVSESNKTALVEEKSVEVDETIHIGILCDKENLNNKETLESASTEAEPMETDEIPTPDPQKCENSEVSIESEQQFEKSTTTENTNEQKKIIIHSVVTIPPPSMYTLDESVDFDFNLDGIEDIPENNEKTENDFLMNDNDNANADCITVPKLSKHDLLKQQLGNFTPCLSGDPNGEIDLDQGVVKPNAVLQLMERFKKHIEVKNISKNKIKLDVVNLSQGELHNEVVVVPVDDKEEPIDATDKPGLRIKKLRYDLQDQIAQQRAELWKKKQQALDEMTKTSDEKTEGKSDYEENVVDEEEEEELTDGSDTDNEEEVYEDDADTNATKEKCAFIDEEAEESDDNDEAENSGIEADDENADDDGDNSRDSQSVEQDKDSSNYEVLSTPTFKKTLKRIIKPFTEDSDEEDLFACDTVKEVTKHGDANTTNTKSWNEENDDTEILPYQPRFDKTPRREMTQSKPDITFHTPITQLSALQGLNSGSKFLRESPVSPFPFPPPSPTVDTPSVKQKLFADSCDVFEPEVSTQELIGLCSGNFSNTEEESDPLKRTQPCTQDLMSICSGAFTGLTNNKTDAEVESLSKNDTEDVPDVSESTDNLIINTNSNSQSKYLDEDRIISQLLDEEELENFKKKFESPVANASSTANINESFEIQGGGRLVFDSSDDECAESNPTIKQNRHKKLDFSDDESEEEVEAENDEEIDLHDDYDDDGEDTSNKLVDYDSEENEIEVPKQPYKASEFFEKEAELTESEWDSADEDERDLDQLEQEQGDEEVFDDNKIKSDLEKIHMRNVLDQDNREIKILQELLLEDGELHGTGRQRQFRWRNIDDNANDDKGPIEGDDVYLDEDESEEQWRRLRHQREMFLKSQEEKRNEDEIDSILSDSNSQVLKIGQEALRRSFSNCSAQSDKEKTVTSSSSAEILHKTSALLGTRGSFLARSDNFLTRLAGITKVNNSTSNVIKTSTKIVFQTSTSIEEISESNKRKADDGTPLAIKKLRLSSNISPSLKGVERKKKLF